MGYWWFFTDDDVREFGCGISEGWRWVDGDYKWGAIQVYTQQTRTDVGEGWWVQFYVREYRGGPTRFGGWDRKGIGWVPKNKNDLRPRRQG